MQAKRSVFIFLLLIPGLSRSTDVVGPRLQFVCHVQENNLFQFYNLPEFQRVPVTLTFTHPICEAELDGLEKTGITMQRYKERALRSERVLTGHLEAGFSDFSLLQEIPGLLEIETTWRPHHFYPLVVSRAQIEAEQVWQLRNPAITGKNILIADLDTGINHFHPMFFFADGDTFNWMDINGNSLFDEGIDGVDLNFSGTVDPDEKLRFIQVVTSGAIPNPPGYNPSIDWIYIDRNQNSQRDYGPSSGFTEADPAYGEPIFIAADLNHNDWLDPAEFLVMLRTSKVRKVYQSNGTIRERGIDLIWNEGDSYGHGTPVSGILTGGVAGVHQMTGIAPDAELLMGVNVYIPDPPFIQTMEFLAPWAAAEGADIILYEDGEWIWQYMDGSSALETMIDDFHSQGILQVVPAGNLARGGMHTSGTIPGNDSADVPVSVIIPGNQQHIWGTFLWRGDPAGITFQLELNTGTWTILPGNGSLITSGNYQVYSNRSQSHRGTCRFDFIISAISGSLSGTYTFRPMNHSSQDIAYHAYEWDDRSSWSGASRWLNANDDGTVTWPSTADHAFSVAAYNPRDSQQPLNGFSGRGNRIDGIRLVDVAAPGSTVYSTSAFNDAGFSAFGGTSAAGPHIAGISALLIQLLGANSMDLITDAIEQGADITGITAGIPNPDWGFGRVRGRQAADLLLTSVLPSLPMVTSDHPFRAYPNPFNPETRLRFFAGRAGKWRISFYNLLGQEIDHADFQTTSPAEITCRWNAAGWGSGIYMAVLSFNGRPQKSQKLVYFK